MSSALVDALVALLVADAKRHSLEEIEAEAVKLQYSHAREISRLHASRCVLHPEPTDEIDWASFTFTWAPRPVARVRSAMASPHSIGGRSS
jgi:hypothetical protein